MTLPADQHAVAEQVAKFEADMAEDEIRTALASFDNGELTVAELLGAITAASFHVGRAWSRGYDFLYERRPGRRRRFGRPG